MTARRFWSAEQEDQLRAIYPDMRAQDVAAIMGCSVKRVYNKAKALGIGKSEAFKKSDLSARIRRGHQSEAMKATQIKPGNIPWNKGVPGSAGLHPNSRRTQFRKGRPPQESIRYQPIGSLRISKDGYLERKITDDHPVPARRWVAVHRLVWETAHGPIPPGHIVVFRRGMRTAIEAEVTVDRLECISRAENAHRNHPRNRDPELGRLVQLKGAITRQVNRIAREAQEQAS